MDNFCAVDIVAFSIYCNNHKRKQRIMNTPVMKNNRRRVVVLRCVEETNQCLHHPSDQGFPVIFHFATWSTPTAAHVFNSSVFLLEE
jgi:hypothetical protein